MSLTEIQKNGIISQYLLLFFCTRISTVLTVSYAPYPAPRQVTKRKFHVKSMHVTQKALYLHHQPMCQTMTSQRLQNDINLCHAMY